MTIQPILYIKILLLVNSVDLKLTIAPMQYIASTHLCLWYVETQFPMLGLSKSP